MTNKSKTPRQNAAREKRLRRFAMIATDVLEVPGDETECIGYEVSDYDSAKDWAAAGWDAPAWDVDVKVQEAEPGWNSTDSGYVSDTTPLEPAPLSAEAIKYQQLPLRSAYYLHSYASRILEACCLKYARKHHAADLSDLMWKCDQVELERWMTYFSRHFDLSSKIQEGVIYLRNAAIHRYDGEKLSYADVVYAMRLPACLQDWEADAEIEDAFLYVIGDPELDKDTTARVEAAMYAPRPCTMDCQLLSQIQTLIEESCFDYASRKIPHVLATKGWEIPEQVELPQWCKTYDTARLQHDDTARLRHDESADTIFPGMDDFSLRNLLDHARSDIRNPAAHFNRVGIDRSVKAVHVAIRLCILQADWRRAIEIEVLAESYFTHRSRAQVLDRLESTYRDGTAETAYEQGRRAAIRLLLEGEGRGQGGDDEVETLEGLGMADPEMRGAEWTWSPSMHGDLKREEEQFD